MSRFRGELKRGLAKASTGRAAQGVTILTYHRVGGKARDELDVALTDFRRQMDTLASRPVVSLDTALDGLEKGDRSDRIVLTFDDGFRDVYENAWPLLRDNRLPFIVYLASAYVGGSMRWAGSTAKDEAAPGLTWDHLEEMVGSGLCTIGNHTHSHVNPGALSESELDSCTEMIYKRLGVATTHFAYPWGIPVPGIIDGLRSRFRSAATGRIGRNLPGADPMWLKRVPVRRTDPFEFFEAKLVGGLFPERVYRAITSTAKKVGAHA